MNINSIIDALETNSVNRDWGKGNGVSKHTVPNSSAAKGQVSNKIYHQLLPFTRSILAQLQPFIDGRCILIPATMPECMRVLHKHATDYMEVLFKTTVTAVTGFDSKKLEVGEVTAISEQNSFQVITKSTGVTRTLNITFNNMYQDIPVFRYINVWMNYIVSSGSYAGLYPHLTDLEYNEGNHSMSCYYIVPDPSFKRVEYGAFIYAMVPLDNGAQEVLDQTWGQSEVKPYPVNFKVHVIPADHPIIYKTLDEELKKHVRSLTLNDWQVDIGDLN